MTEVQSTATGIGIIGCGNIFERYVAGIRRFEQLRIVGCADVDASRARTAEAEHGVSAFASPAALLACDEVEVVVNITNPVAHAAVSIAALQAGKDVYVEKPLAATLDEASGVLDTARRRGRLVGCAPDTFLGSAVQTARGAIDDGLIGDPIGAASFVTHHRVEEWHPDPTFLFEPGGGPLLDMGPYYVTALVTLLGPVAEVGGLARIGATHRTVTAPGRLVDSVRTTVPTHTTAAARFANGVVLTMLMSFDVWHQEFPYIEVYGTKGALRLADPNNFDGDVFVRLHADTEWRVLSPRLERSGEVGTRDQLLRGIGVADLVNARGGAAHRATGELAYHVLEVLSAVETSGTQDRFVRISSTTERPAPLDAASDAVLMPWDLSAAL